MNIYFLFRKKKNSKFIILRKGLFINYWAIRSSLGIYSFALGLKAISCLGSRLEIMLQAQSEIIFFLFFFKDFYQIDYSLRYSLRWMKRQLIHETSNERPKSPISAKTVGAPAAESFPLC